MVNLIDGLFFFSLALLGIGLLGCISWFFEGTKIGQKLTDKLYDYFMKK